MSASEKLKALDRDLRARRDDPFAQPDFADLCVNLLNALPQIVAVVEAVENEDWMDERHWEIQAAAIGRIQAALTALDEELTPDLWGSSR